ncbi:MAG: nucleotidyltransferase domain-containing protein [Candidatus Korarchaeota archaeon]|nr:nucleotidyltransferase domain-containing protein [Candidatus Korarchaeota archaeon]
MIIDRIKKVLEHRDEVVFAYLFGSVAKGEAGKLSDIDIAVYLDPNLSRERMHEIFIEIASELSFRDIRIDLILLNTANYRLAYEVLKGKLLFSRNEELRREFIYRTLRTYLDRRYYDLRRVNTILSR